MERRFAMILTMLAGASTASASPARLEIVGDACSLDTLDAQIAQLASTDDGEQPVRVETVRTADGVQANIWFPAGPEGQRGPRVVEASTCSQLTESAALVIAMALPERARADEPATRTVTSEVVAAGDTAVASNGEVAVEHPTHLGIYVSGGSGISTHGPRGRLLVGASARRGALSLGLEARVDADETYAISEMAGIQVSRAAAALGGCVHRGSFGVCGVASVGTIHGAGVGLHAARDVHTPMVATGLRLTWERTLVGPIAVRAYAEAQALLTETTFDVDLMPVWKSERVEGSGGLGLLARFL
ncbi:MAG: hypothetical protein HOV81_00385 [Kofleriaceae bacterium]|nr:hypothetical protein [Kofleriaceae bacterium]